MTASGKGLILLAAVLATFWFAAFAYFAIGPGGPSQGPTPPAALREEPGAGGPRADRAPRGAADERTQLSTAPADEAAPFGDAIPVDAEKPAPQSPGQPARGPAGEPEGQGAKETGDADGDASGGPSPASDKEGGDAGPVTLTERERERAEAGAFNYLTYAYGYTGENRQQYEAYVNQAVVPETYRASEGAETTDAFADNVESSGVESRLIDQEIELTPTSEERAQVEATFVVEDASGKRNFSQEMVVVALGPIWKVASAGPLEEAR